MTSLTRQLVVLSLSLLAASTTPAQTPASATSGRSALYASVGAKFTQYDVNLDGAALTVDDPFKGATIEQGQIRLPLEPGLGVRRK